MTNQSPAKADERDRRTERVLLRIPIEVKGATPDGRGFAEQTFTVVINRHGARIRLTHSPRPDDRVTITNLQTKVSCPFRVVGRTSDTIGDGPEWGVECLHPDDNFWGIDFPKKAPAAKQERIDALLECSKCHFRELAQLTLEHYRVLVNESSLRRNCARCGTQTEWGFGFVEVEAEEADPAQPGSAVRPLPSKGMGERRISKRLTVKLPVRLCLEDGREELTRTENLSKTGVCFVSGLGMKEGDGLRLTVGYAQGSNEATIPARVVWRREVGGKSNAMYGVRLEEGE